MGRHLVSGPSVGAWVALRTGGGVFSADAMTAIGLENDGQIVAGVMYENWNGKSIVAHMAVTGRLTRGFIGEIFRYAFQKCGVEKVILPIASTNVKSLSFAENLGFTEEARIKDAAPGGDIILCTLSRSECRFLGKKFNGKT